MFLAQMDSTRQEPVVETQQTIPRLKRRQWVRTEGHGGEGSRAVGGAKGQDGSHGALKGSFMKFRLFLPTSICKVTTN